MGIHYGTVSKYFPEKGFGFLRSVFNGTYDADVFFHIKTIRKTSPDLAVNLEQNKAIYELNFWYETEVANKGEQARRILQINEVQTCDAGSIASLANKVEMLWRDISLDQPEWLEDVTLALMGERRKDELFVEREKLQDASIINAEIERSRLDAKRRAEEFERLKATEERKAQQELEEREFAQLVAEMKPLGFRESRDVSLYIVHNRLGLKYQNISGIVRMMQSGDTWDFKGGFPPKIYARLCEELDLGNRGTRAHAIGFTPFRDTFK